MGRQQNGDTKQPVRVDTHHHMVPDFYREWLAEKGVTAGGKAIPHWSVSDALKFMDETGVKTSILSVSTPGVEPGISAGTNEKGVLEARSMARRLNEYSAEISQRNPERFGFFATLTLPDLDGALEELRYVDEVLQSDGVVLLANTDGRYLGDPAFEELVAEIARRDMVIFVHPSHLQVEPVDGLPPYVVDFLLDTSRAAANIVKSGTFNRYPDLKVVLSHGGGFVPYAAGRMGEHISPDGTTQDGLHLLQKFYFDTALTSSKYGLPSLVEFADPNKILYGSDYPYAAPVRSKWFTENLDKSPLVNHDAINFENAEKLFPRFKGKVKVPLNR